jgi:tetratricopeptide (TPR) repeat protein
MELSNRGPSFRKRKRRSNLYRMMVWTALIVAGFLIARGVETREIKPLFYPTATPTRTLSSLEQEARTYFDLGKLDCRSENTRDCAIWAYQEAIRLNSQNPRLYLELARIQTYSSVMLSTDEEQLGRMQEALENVNKAVELNPEDSSALAIRAFVLDWYATKQLVSEEERSAMLNEAEQVARQAYDRDPNNTVALVYYAEILLDQHKWMEAEQTIQLAIEQPDAQTLMDFHRVNGLVAENLAEYNRAIEEYQKASEISPNLTFLYIRIGRLLFFQKKYDEAFASYGKAVTLNERLGIKDPYPYLAIADGYANRGDFFGAVLNVRGALELDPSDPKVFAQLGMVYHRSKNYEGSIEAFHCALEGCTAEEACKIHQSSEECIPDEETPMVAVPGPMALTDTTVLYYYTYGSVLAGLHKPTRPYCDRALDILSMVRSSYSDDAEIMSIVEASEAICTPMAASLPASDVPATATAIPTAMPTAMPTP